MPVQCSDIETHAQTYLDGELTDADGEAFETHLVGCDDCTARLAADAADHRELRRRLAPPPAPDLLRARVRTALDADDRAAAARARKDRWGWALPGAAGLAAVAALALFVVTGRAPTAQGSVAVDAVRQHMRRAPIEVQGANVSPWVERHFQPQVQLPRFSDRNVELLGARLSHLSGRDALQLFYNITRPGNRYPVSVHIVESAGLPIRGEQRVSVGGRELWVDQQLGYSTVTYDDQAGLAYVFTSEMPAATLVDLVTTSDLVLRVHEGLQRNRH